MLDPAPQPSSAASAFPLSRRAVVYFALGAAALFSVLAWAITVFHRGRPFLGLFVEGLALPAQMTLGALAGAAVGAVIAMILLRIRLLAPVRAFVLGILGHVRPTALELIAVSVLAGFSEELFFRGTLQPMWGLWLAALAFALAHVGGNVFSLPKAAFAAYVFAMGLLFGLLKEHGGLVAAMTAHSACNTAFLLALNRRAKSRGSADT